MAVTLRKKACFAYGWIDHRNFGLDNTAVGDRVAVDDLLLDFGSNAPLIRYVLFL